MDMMNVYDVTTAILKREGNGRYTNRAADKGGPTRWGITAKTLGQWRTLGREATPEEVQALTEDEARRIFETVYYEEPRYQRLGDARVEAFLYDSTVTSGYHHTVILLQRALTLPEPERDGALGERTLKAWRAADAGVVYAALIKERLRFMVQIALHDPAVVAFVDAHPATPLRNLAGWVNRTLEFVS
jgi:lysozyme family protein